MAHFLFGLGLIAVTFIEPNTDKATQVPATGASINTPLEPNTDKATQVPATVAGFDPAPHTSQTTPPSPQTTVTPPSPQTTLTPPSPQTTVTLNLQTTPPSVPQTTAPPALQTTSPSALQTTSPSAIQTTSSSTPPVVSKQSQELAKAIGGGVGGLFLILLATQKKIASNEEFTRSCIHFWLFKLSLPYCKSTAYNRESIAVNTSRVSAKEELRGREEGYLMSTQTYNEEYDQLGCPVLGPVNTLPNYVPKWNSKQLHQFLDRCKAGKRQCNLE
ncbi:hypothetical protein BDP27DRAFT_1370776 [Rhodocollybia butyracea]|uniref:Uncharacterized protein n=1 Tax=Rhodocollybia butyracea TaxID=206335 RepID=A0A9P5P8G3_9AGAR|nr:hypothetical protein BDP27DRAFT_1370776 [Rhodocollybia butyracea]